MIVPADADIASIIEAAVDENQRRRAILSVDSLAEFVRFLWPVIEPGTPLAWNWHIPLICAELEAVTRGDFNELAICIPPGSLKSVLVSVMWSAWEWLRYPHLRGLHISNSERLCVRDSRRMRDIVQSARYRLCMEAAHELHGVPLWELSKDQSEKVHFANTEYGSRLAIPSSARVTGDRGDKLVVDDAVDAQEAVIGSPEQIARRMEEVQHKYDHVWASRLNNPRNPRVTIAQRLAPGDLPGVLIERGVRHVVLPMEFDPDSPYRHPNDPRTERGELLFPERFTREYVEKLKTTPGASRHYMAQYQQSPPPMGGGTFRKEWFRYYRVEGDAYIATLANGRIKRVPKGDCWRILVSDTALSTRTMADFSVIQVWDVLRNKPRGEHRNGDDDLTGLTSSAFLVDQWRGQVSGPDYEDQLMRMREQYKPLFVALEYATPSMATVDRLIRHGIPVKKLMPKKYGGDKVNRAYAASLWIENERVFFPQFASWLGELESELLAFPGAQHDDQVDTTVYAVLTVEDRDLWEAPKSDPLPPDAIGRFLGHTELLPQYMDGEPDDRESVFAANNLNDEF